MAKKKSAIYLSPSQTQVDGQRLDVDACTYKPKLPVLVVAWVTSTHYLCNIIQHAPIGIDVVSDLSRRIANMKVLFSTFLHLLLVTNIVAFPFFDWLHSLEKRDGCGSADVNVVYEYLSIYHSSEFCWSYLGYSTSTHTCKWY